jgi:hypothetical protein
MLFLPPNLLNRILGQSNDLNYFYKLSSGRWSKYFERQRSKQLTRNEQETWESLFWNPNRMNFSNSLCKLTDLGLSRAFRKIEHINLHFCKLVLPKKKVSLAAVWIFQMNVLRLTGSRKLEAKFWLQRNLHGLTLFLNCGSNRGLLFVRVSRISAFPEMTFLFCNTLFSST